MARRSFKSEKELEIILDKAGLELAEEYSPDKGYPQTRWLLTRCKACGTVAHYRLGYIQQKTGQEVVCRACFWRGWFRESRAIGGMRSGLAGHSGFLSDAAAEDIAARNGYELVSLIHGDLPGEDVFVVRCKACGRQTAERAEDLEWGCSCKSHPNTPTLFSPTEPHLLCDSNDSCLPWWDHDKNDEVLFKTVKRLGRQPVWWKCPECGESFKAQVCKMSDKNGRGPSCPACNDRRFAQAQAKREELRHKTVADFPKLLAAWADERDPRTVSVMPAGYWAMSPGDGLCRFECPKGHHPQVTPISYLENGCPFCRGELTKKQAGTFIADTAPELAEEWCRGRNGRWTPDNVKENSKREVWWSCLACGYEWKEAPRERIKVRGGKCPSCGKILGSLAWVYPGIASEWSVANPISPWETRPLGKLAFVPEWVCANNPSHRWRMSLAGRVHGGGCPECQESGKSKVELSHFEAAVRAFGHARSGATVNERERYSYPWSIDILASYRGMLVAIEYDGAYWHQNKADTDELKSRELMDGGYVVCRLREEGLPSLGIADSRYHEIFVRPSAPRPDAVMEEVRVWLDSLVSS